MKRFNLIPGSPNGTPERRTRRNSKDMELIFALVPIIIAFVVVFFLHTNNSRNKSQVDPLLMKKYKSLKKELSAASSGNEKSEEAGDINALIEEKSRIKSNLLRLRGLAESKKIPVGILVSISNNISERVALTMIDKKQETVTLEGIAQDNESLSDFIDTLINAGAFKNVELKLTQYSDEFGLYKQRFVMECSL